MHYFQKCLVKSRAFLENMHVIVNIEKYLLNNIKNIYLPSFDTFMLMFAVMEVHFGVRDNDGFICGGGIIGKAV